MRRSFIAASAFVLALAWCAAAQSGGAQRSVDTSKQDARIREALQKAKAPNATEADRRALAAAYLERADIYYNAGVPQLYRLALGDLRRVLRYDPSNTDAKEKLDMLVSIYNSLGRPVPENGNDPNDDGLTMNAANPTASSSITDGAQRVRFAENQTTRTVRGALSAGKSLKYIVAAKAGSKLALRVKSPQKGVLLRIYNARTNAPLEGANGVAEWRGDAPETGDYIIEVTSDGTTKDFVVEISVARDTPEIRSY